MTTPSVIDELLIGLLFYGVFPLWVVAGFVDYCCHRATRIERTTGRAESTLHIVQYLEIVAGLALGVFLEPTSLVLVLMIVLALLHLATGYLDIAYTTGRRYISPPEQHVHSYMEVLPLIATALVLVLYWNAFAAIFDGGSANWALTRREPHVRWSAIAVIAGSAWHARALLSRKSITDVPEPRVGRAISIQTTRHAARAVRPGQVGDSRLCSL